MKRKAIQMLQNDYLYTLKKNKTLVAIYLIHGIKLVGQIQAFDDQVIILKNIGPQMIYKNKISTVIPVSQSMQS